MKTNKFDKLTSEDQQLILKICDENPYSFGMSLRMTEADLNDDTESDLEVHMAAVSMKPNGSTKAGPEIISLLKALAGTQHDPADSAPLPNAMLSEPKQEADPGTKIAKTPAIPHIP